MLGPTSTRMNEIMKLEKGSHGVKTLEKKLYCPDGLTQLEELTSTFMHRWYPGNQIKKKAHMLPSMKQSNIAAICGVTGSWHPNWGMCWWAELRFAIMLYGIFQWVFFFFFSFLFFYSISRSLWPQNTQLYTVK